MKNLFKILILFLILDTFSLSAQEEYNNRIQPYKVWQAKKVTVLNYNGVKKHKKVIKLGLANVFVSNESIEYNEKGNITKFISYNRYGGVTISESYNYDSLDNLVERCMITYNQDTLCKSYLYYEDTLLVKQLDYSRIIDTNIIDSINFKIGLVGITNYQYNNMDKLIESDYESINTYPFKKSKIKYTLDESNNIIKVINLSFDTIEAVTEFEYDENGNIISKKDFDSKGDLFGSIKYQYDKNSKLIREERKNSPLDKIVIYTYKYNTSGDVMEIESTFKDYKSKRKYEYLYDEYGNWFERIEFLGKKNFNIVKRKIEY